MSRLLKAAFIAAFVVGCSQTPNFNNIVTLYYEDNWYSSPSVAIHSFNPGTDRTHSQFSTLIRTVSSPALSPSAIPVIHSLSVDLDKSLGECEQPYREKFDELNQYFLDFLSLKFSEQSLMLVLRLTEKDRWINDVREYDFKVDTPLIFTIDTEFSCVRGQTFAQQLGHLIEPYQVLMHELMHIKQAFEIQSSGSTDVRETIQDEYIAYLTELCFRHTFPSSVIWSFTEEQANRIRVKEFSVSTTLNRQTFDELRTRGLHNEPVAVVLREQFRRLRGGDNYVIPVVGNEQLDMLCMH